MNLFQEKPDTFSIQFNLISAYGKADIYVKECLPAESKCQINLNDVNNSYGENYEEYYPGRLFRFSRNDPKVKDKSIIEDNLLLNFNCMGRMYVPRGGG